MRVQEIEDLVRRRLACGKKFVLFVQFVFKEKQFVFKPPPSLIPPVCVQ